MKTIIPLAQIGSSSHNIVNKVNRILIKTLFYPLLWPGKVLRNIRISRFTQDVVERRGMPRRYKTDTGFFDHSTEMQ